MHHSILRPGGRRANFTKPAVRLLIIGSTADGGHDEPAEWVLIERSERSEVDGGRVHRASICIRYWLLRGELPYSDVPSGEFDGYYDAVQGGVSITSGGLEGDGYVVVDPPRLRGKRVGTYLMNEIVTWAKQWPDAAIKEISLLIGDAAPANRERRNKFYTQFGIAFDFSSSDQATGVSRPMRAADLTAVTTWKESITEHDLPRFLRQLREEKEDADQNARRQDRSITELNKAMIAAESDPVRWAIKTLLLYHPGLVVLAVLIGITAAVALW